MATSTRKVKNEGNFEWLARVLFHLIVFWDGFPFRRESYISSWAEVVFRTRIYHCNVEPDGRVSMGILKDGWSPALTITKVLLAVRSLLTNPDPYNAVVPGIAHLYLGDRAKHDDIAAEWTIRFAK
ncbi:E2 ubiquitin-conjugating enzyme [Trifolium repens]|nr:ubiquitin-conjugating enzyme E2-17 kDa [Trifolium repens]WJX47216.1 E2 ubiquitin-conjugating enzyme [Trifolium repens]